MNRDKLVHSGGLQKFEVLYCKNLVTRYILPNHKISGELKSCCSV